MSHSLLGDVLSVADNTWAFFQVHSCTLVKTLYMTNKIHPTVALNIRKSHQTQIQTLRLTVRKSPKTLVIYPPACVSSWHRSRYSCIHRNSFGPSKPAGTVMQEGVFLPRTLGSDTRLKSPDSKSSSISWSHLSPHSHPLCLPSECWWRDNRGGVRGSL